VRGIDRIRGIAESGVEKLLVVLGASGSGKSSFLRAGPWPRLARDNANFRGAARDPAADGGHQW
jgi:hypothetical protein